MGVCNLRWCRYGVRAVDYVALVRLMRDGSDKDMWADMRLVDSFDTDVHELVQTKKREQPPYILTRLLSNAIRRWTQKHRMPCSIPALTEMIGSCRTCPLGPKAARDAKLPLSRKRDGAQYLTCRPWEKAIDAGDKEARQAALQIAEQLKTRSDVEQYARKA